MNRVILITGGSRGIGFMTAKLFLENGDRVAICSENKERLREAEKELTKLGEVLAVSADVRDFNQLSRFVDEAVKRFGRIDVLVNNAGVAWSGSFIEEDLESIDHQIDVNVKGVLYGARVALPKMVEQGSGIIINISSGAGKSGIPGLATYCASKFAVVGFTEALAGEVGRQGIKVYAVCPGAVATDMQVDVSGMKKGMPPERVARAIMSLIGQRPPINPGECLEIYS